MLNGVFKRRQSAKTKHSISEENRVISTLSASPHVSESHDGRYARALILTVVYGLIGFFYWAAMTPVYEVVSGSGTIRPEGLSTRIEHLEGGIVSHVDVAEGDLVNAGDILFALDDSDLRAELEKLRAQSANLKQNISRYEALLALDLLSGSLRLDAEIFREADPSFLEEVSYRRAQLRTLRSERQVAETQEAALEARLKKFIAEIEILRGQLERYESAGNRSVIPLSQREDLRREVIRLESSITQLHGEILVQRASLKQLEASEGELVAQYRREAALRLDEQRAENITAEQTIAQVEDRLRRSVLKAPVSGVVNALAVQNAGEVVAPGEIIAEIIPSDTRAFAEIEVPADRIGGVKVGREASLKILTYDFTRFGDITAVVERISPSSFLKETGESVFRVQLSFEEGQAPGDGGQRPVSPGMTVVADIKSERRTVLSYLLKPVRVIADRAFTEA